MSRVSVALLCVAVGLLAGCAQQQTRLDLTLTATERLNPDLHGRPSPVVVRLVELRERTAFERADFFSLYGAAGQALPDDLVYSKELELRPGAQATLTLLLEPGSQYVGVLAAYRDLPHARWRQVLVVPRQRRGRAELVLDQAGIRPLAPVAGRTPRMCRRGTANMNAACRQASQ